MAEFGGTNETGITIEQLINMTLIERARNDFKFDINKHVEEEDFVLKVNSGGQIWDLAGLGAIGVIAGPPKSRKTAITSAITAAGLGGCEVLGFQLGIAGGHILNFDTEQREGSFAKVNRSIHKWAKIGRGANPENYEAFQLRKLFPEQRLDLIRSLTLATNPKLLVIDVISDLMYDFNDNVGSQKIVEEIMKLAGTNTLTILTIHLGKGGLILGHLGSALSRKLDFLLQIEQSSEDWTESVVECKLTRDVPMFPKFNIKQESKPPRIYRPDLEINKGFGEIMEAAGQIIPISGMDLRVGVKGNVDDNIPF